jgi:hypothetical protein
MTDIEDVARLAGEGSRPVLLFSDSFADMSNWLDLNPRTEWTVADGTLNGKWAPGGSVVWLKPSFDGDLAVYCQAETLIPTAQDWRDWDLLPPPADMPEGGKNLNLFMLCSGPGGEHMRDCYAPLLATGTGPNAMGEDQYKGYFFTWTLGWARFRYLPGYACVSELSGEGFSSPAVGRRHNILALRQGQRVRCFIDGRMIHDYLDPDPPGRGQMGFCLWRNLARIHKFEVYQLASEVAASP